MTMSINTSTRQFCWRPSLVRPWLKRNSDTTFICFIPGGTDICSLFAGMCTALPVYRGEIQCRMLGMAIESYAPMGTPNPAGEAGELVCLKPFPCMPVGFWPLPGFGKKDEVETAKARYHQAYFSEFEGVWRKWASYVMIT
jgi:acetoacetyl-CoA synthetase